MNQDRITERAKQAGGAKYVNRHTPDAAAFGFMQEQLQRFAELVRAEALEEAMRVLEFHGFDDAIPYVKWAAVNGRSKT